MNPMTMNEIEKALAGVRPATKSGDPKSEDGTRVHVHYGAFGKPTERAKEEAMRAADLGLERDRFTGRVSKVWRSKTGDLLVTLFVELERDHKWRTLNLNKGVLYRFVVIGN